MRKVVSLLCMATFVGMAALAQTPSDPQGGPMPMPGFHMALPRALMGNWWRDPAVINQLHLTEAQRNQLEQASVNLKLALISDGAAGATALVKAESALNSDQLNQAGYTQQVDALSDAAAKLVKDIGASVLSMRKILSADQWQQLQAMRGHERMMMRERGPRPMEPHNERPNSGTVPRDQEPH